MSHDSEGTMPLNSWMEIMRRVNYYMDSQYNDPPIASSRIVAENISWKPPDIGWIRLNTDDMSKGGFIAGCGGVLQGENEEWICGF